MVKEKRILSYFIGWLIVGIFLCFIGITKTHAATYYLNYQYNQKYYDNFGSSVSAVSTTWNDSLQSYVSGNIGTTANSYGAGLAISSPIPILANHTYTISLYFEDKNNIALSSKNHIAISTSLDGSASNYANGNYYVDMRQSNVNNNTLLQFVFTAKGHGNFIFIPWTTTYNTTQSYITTQISMEDLGSEGVSQQDINNSLNNQTNQLNQSIQNSTDTITGELDDMEQSIIDSNKETQEVIKDQFNSCRESKNLLNVPENYSLKGYQDFNINLTAGTYTISANSIESTGLRQLMLLTENGTEVLVFALSSDYLYRTFTLSQNIDTLRIYSADTYANSQNITTIFNGLMLEKGTSKSQYEPYGEEICSNKIDETNDKLDNLQGAITDSSSPNTGALENSAGWLPPGPLDSVLNLPLSLFNALTTNLNKSCNPINIPLPFVNKNITLPCINTLYEQIGITSFLSWIGVIVSGLMLYTYLLKLYKWIEDRISLNETHNVDSWGGL